MYSLDQVIYFLEKRQQTEDWNIRDMAIAYLRGYREILPEYAQMKLDAVNDVNDPLTWDELKAMEGKPVWVDYESCNRKSWAIVDCFYTDAFFKDRMNVALPHDYWHLEKEMIGKTWQAYRKERK